MATRKIAALAATLLLAGCDPQEAVPSATLRGIVADGYLVGVRVCLDLNDNFACDGGEPFDTTHAGGAWSLSVPPTAATSHRVLAEVPATAIDEDTGAATGAAFVLTAPAGRHDVINPVTTLLVERMRIAGETAEAAATALAPLLQVADPATLFRDFAGVGATAEQQALHAFSRVAARALGGAMTDIAIGLGGSVPTLQRANAQALAGELVLAEAAALRGQVFSGMSEAELAAVQAPTLSISAVSIADQLALARFAEDLNSGLCDSGLDCFRSDGETLVNTYWTLNTIHVLEQRTPSLLMLELGSAGWVLFDQYRRPYEARENRVYIHDHSMPGGSENWTRQGTDISGMSMDSFNGLIGVLRGSTTTIFPPGSRLYTATAVVNREERLQLNPSALPQPAQGTHAIVTLDDMLAWFAAGNADDAWAYTYGLYLYAGRFQPPGLAGYYEMQFAGDGTLLRRLRMLDGSGTIQPLLNGGWQRTDARGVDALALRFSETEPPSMYVVEHEGGIHVAQVAYAESTTRKRYLLNAAAFDVYRQYCNNYC